MDSKCDFLRIFFFFLHKLILCNVFFKVTHVGLLPFISAKNCDENALQNRRGRPVLHKFGSLTVVFSVLSFSQNLPIYTQFLPRKTYHNLCWQPYRKFPDLLHETILNATYLSHL